MLAPVISSLDEVYCMEKVTRLDLRINNARRTVLARVSGLVFHMSVENTALPDFEYTVDLV